MLLPLLAVGPFVSNATNLITKVSCRASTGVNVLFRYEGANNFRSGPWKLQPLYFAFLCDSLYCMYVAVKAG